MRVEITTSIDFLIFLVLEPDGERFGDNRVMSLSSTHFLSLANERRRFFWTAFDF